MLQRLLGISDHRGSDTDVSVCHFLIPPLDYCRTRPFRLKCLLGDSLLPFRFFCFPFGDSNTRDEFAISQLSFYSDKNTLQERLQGERLYTFVGAGT